MRVNASCPWVNVLIPKSLGRVSPCNVPMFSSRDWTARSSWGALAFSADGVLPVKCEPEGSAMGTGKPCTRQRQEAPFSVASWVALVSAILMRLGLFAAHLAFPGRVPKV
jgi:hypothetical protein